MAVIHVRTYGEGGWNPDLPNGNLIEAEAFTVTSDQAPATVDDVRQAVAGLGLPDDVHQAFGAVLDAVQANVEMTPPDQAPPDGAQRGVIARVLGLP